MLPRVTVGFLVLSAAVAIAACSSYSSATNINVGPNFPSLTLYATNSNQNAISIYNKGQKSGTSPAYQIGGSSTTLNGPQYIAFDRGGNLWITNYNPSNRAAKIVEIEALATGNVIPLTSASILGYPRGIAITPTSSPSAAFMPMASPTSSAAPTPVPVLMVIADVNPTSKYPSQIQLYLAGTTTPYQMIAGPLPNLNVPGGIALDKNNEIYVANIQGASVQGFVLPSPSPTPKTTPTPSPTPSPTPTPTGSPSTSPSPSPTPSPTPTPINVAPKFTIVGGPTARTGVTTPVSVAVDNAGNVYVVDQGNPKAGVAPSVLVFAKPSKRIIDTPPTRRISGKNTMLFTPTDIKIDSSGLIYVADSSSAGKGLVLIFAAGAKGNVAPVTTYNSPGAVTGIGIVP